MIQVNRTKSGAGPTEQSGLLGFRIDEEGTIEIGDRAVQRLKERVHELWDAGGPVLFEGQTRLAFLREALDSAGLGNAHVILVDCDDATRARRLTLARKQPDLVNQKMMDWAGFLRREAHEAGYEVLDTAAVPLVACIELVRKRLGVSSAAAVPEILIESDASLKWCSGQR